MKCTSKRKVLHQIIVAGLLSFLLIFGITGCGQLDYSVAYGSDGAPSTVSIGGYSGTRTETFAKDLCVYEGDVLGDGTLDLTQCESAVLCDVNNKDVIYSKNAFEQLYPASLTKIMTALVALKYGDMEQILVATDAVVVHESGAQLAGIKPGDSMTLNQALRIMLLYSANDVSLLIADNLGGGDVNRFVDMMNEEAKNLGATGTHFMNPHGLSNPEHYTTAYDLYLIFNECIKYEDFVEIISMPSFETTYKSMNGQDVHLQVNNTNGYITGKHAAPVNTTVIGGKTGTTSAAGHCLIILSKDINGAPYISVVLKSESTESLYNNMNSLLGNI